MVHWAGRVLAALVLTATALGAADKELVIVVNRESALSTMSAADLKRVYTGRLSVLGGKKAVPINQTLDSEVAGAFLKEYVGMTAAEYKEYWVGQQVKGGGVAPMIQKTSASVLLMVSQLPGAIGYMYSDDTDSTVKVVPVK